MIEAETDEYSKAVFGRSISKRSINKGGLMNMFNQLWQNKACEKVEDYTDGIFILTLESRVIKNRVLRGQPWNFSGNYLIFIDPTGLEHVSEENFQGISFWIHVYGIPFRKVNFEMGKEIANIMGRFLEYDSSTKRPFMRFRVELDVTKPLIKRLQVDLSSLKDSIWISFKYERLNKFCFFCGCLDHIQKNCVSFLEELQKGFNPNLEYDDSLKAAPLPIPHLPFNNNLTDVEVAKHNNKAFTHIGFDKVRSGSEVSNTDNQNKRIKLVEIDKVPSSRYVENMQDCSKNIQQKKLDGGDSKKAANKGVKE
ncbi:hypothetical protein F8388_012453 [Cannabis sativa]|uniref:DUF4283 domain-containing protein n=1 Tax=Cannabis sativa TaxID=3483 RepID=A0A7J6EE46_CANSA|nr:hypothetical protein G4B88_011634 [Cannabis sativa]KAF4388476.1 hypothetical protein F8388_012453 [Cannabis sativa]